MFPCMVNRRYLDWDMSVMVNRNHGKKRIMSSPYIYMVTKVMDIFS